jgi:hypothetical protein
VLAGWLIFVKVCDRFEGPWRAETRFPGGGLGAWHFGSGLKTVFMTVRGLFRVLARSIVREGVDSVAVYMAAWWGG